MNTFTLAVINILKQIPEGKVATYGQIASLAGNKRGARQVVRILRTQTKKHSLPWYRVVNGSGKISIKDPIGSMEQKMKLIAEGVEVTSDGRIDLNKYAWEES